MGAIGASDDHAEAIVAGGVGAARRPDDVLIIGLGRPAFEVALVEARQKELLGLVEQLRVAASVVAEVGRAEVPVFAVYRSSSRTSHRSKSRPQSSCLHRRSRCHRRAPPRRMPLSRRHRCFEDMECRSPRSLGPSSCLAHRRLGRRQRHRCSPVSRGPRCCKRHSHCLRRIRRLRARRCRRR